MDSSQRTSWEKLGEQIPPEQRTPLVEQLLRIIQQQQEEIQQLREEIDRLKGETTRPRLKANVGPSSLEDAQPPSKRPRKKRKRKRPGSSKRKKTRRLRIDEDIILRPDDLPPGATPLGYEDFTVQDLILRGHNVRYRRARYRLPNGTLATAALPPDVNGHFGPTLRGFVLYQHFQNHVTQPLIHEELLELGVDISTGQVNRLLTEGHDIFHEEKDQLLPAGLAVSPYVHADDTGARHAGRNGYTTHLGNEWFASFTTSDTKSRVNFLKILLSPCSEYVLDGDAMFFAECYGLAGRWQQQVEALLVDGHCTFADEAAWQAWLETQQITSSTARRILTESALLASLLHYDVLGDLVLVSDDAPQFEVLGILHALCWIHAERWINKLVPLSARERRAQEHVQDEFWEFYQQLKAYRKKPTTRKRKQLECEFDRLFTRRTGFVELNEVLRRIHGRREAMLVVLERPEIPLHNNLSERDIRDFVKKRKISSGTRSPLGRRCRDTFLSLKKTCRKLGVSFWQYLQDRLRCRHEILPLPDLIRSAIPLVPPT
jgi:hypothetical protein